MTEREAWLAGWNAACDWLALYGKNAEEEHNAGYKIIGIEGLRDYAEFIENNHRLPDYKPWRIHRRDGESLTAPAAPD